MILSRRDLLRRAGAYAGTTLLAACGSGSPPGEGGLRAAAAPDPGDAGSSASSPGACRLTPAQTEGPFFVDRRLERSDLRSDPADGSEVPGVRLELSLRVLAHGADACSPVAGAVVDLWHCDAAGRYSGVDGLGISTLGLGFLRGYQRTDATGEVRFTTIYPGWYPGRAVHVHFKVRAARELDSPRPDSGPAARAGWELTSQLYFDEAVTARVHDRSPYASHGAAPRNARDFIFRDGGPSLLLSPYESGSGFEARFDIGMDLA